jgi:hypothetical protein
MYLTSCVNTNSVSYFICAVCVFDTSGGMEWISLHRLQMICDTDCEVYQETASGSHMCRESRSWNKPCSGLSRAPLLFLN